MAWLHDNLSSNLFCPCENFLS